MTRWKDAISTILEMDESHDHPDFVFGSPIVAPFYYATTSFYEEANSAIERDLVRKRIEELRALRDDWDGYGADRVSEQSLANAIALADAAVTSRSGAGLPEISPNPNGTVSLEWEQSGREAYVEIGRTRVMGYLKAQNSPAVHVQGSAIELAALLPAMLGMLQEPSRAIAPTVTAVSPDDV